MLIPVTLFQSEGWPCYRKYVGVRILSYVKNDDAKVTGRDCTCGPLLETVKNGLSRFRCPEVELMVFIVENRNAELVEIAAVELKI